MDAVLAELHFIRPLWFLALLALIPLLVLLWRRGVGGSSWSRVVDAHLLPHLLANGVGGSRRLPIALLALGWLVVVIALAGPVWQRLPQPVFSLTEQHVFVIDLSPSMDAADVAPSRLARARFELLDLLRASREGESALVAAGPEPFLVSPLSADSRTIAAQVPALATALIPVPGPRRLDLALQMAGALLERPGGASGDVILIGDGIGEGAARAAAIDAAQGLAAAGHRVSVLAVGTDQGAPVPKPGGGFVSDATGAIGIARLDSAGLRDLAAAGGGRYVGLDTAAADTLALLAGNGIRPGGETAAAQGLEADQWREEGPWLLLLLIPVAALAFRRGWLLPALLVALFLPSRESLALGWGDLWQRPDQQGARALERGDHAVAAERFEDPAWRAAARYRAGDFAGSLDDLSALEGPEAAYNRGNALARLGRLEAAMDAYRETLGQVPDHADARANLELLTRLLEQQAQQSQSRSGDSGQSDQTDQSERSEQSGDSGQSDSGQSDQPLQSSQGERGEGAQDQSQGSGSAQGSSDSGGQDQDRPSETAQAGSASQDADETRQSGDGQGSATAGERPDEHAQTGEDPATGGADRQAGRRGAEPEAGDLTASQAQDQTEDQAQDETRGELGGASAAGAAASTSDTAPGDAPSGSIAAEPAEVTPDAAEGAGLAATGDLSPGERERIQAVESQLRRVPDDPAGLLRQRFILQHLRRAGRLQ